MAAVPSVYRFLGFPGYYTALPQAIAAAEAKRVK